MRLPAYVRFPGSRLFLIVALLGLVPARGAAAATLTVCASGCAYSDLQAALEAAQPGDTVLLRAGETFIGNFTLPVKPSGAPISVRSDAPVSMLPAAGTRLIPSDYSGGNTERSALARLRGTGGIWKTTPVLQTAPGAHDYRLQFLDIDGIAQEGWETLIELGSNSSEQTTLDLVPRGIVLDRVFVHGHPTKGQKRCVSLNGSDIDVRDSYIASCTSTEFDAQALAGFNGPGPIRIINNYLEASGENVMFGGADPKISGLVPSDIEIRGNYFTKPLAWRDPILPAPADRPIVTSISGGGSLPGGAQYFSVVAVLPTGNDVALSKASPETVVSTGGGTSVTLSWSAVAGAERYRVYRGSSSLGQNVYIETSGPETSMTYRGSGETGGSPPADGTRWNVKNLLELKNAQRVIVDGNVFEHAWAASQTGYAIVMTPRNQEGTAPWSVVRDITLTNNVIRHIAGGIMILGDDYTNGSLQTERITIRNNLVYDLSDAWGGSSHFLLITRYPLGVTVDHNTIFQDGIIVLADDGETSGFVFTNNLAPHNTYGIFGSGAGIGLSTLAAYFPGAVFRRNALGGGPASLYPPDNLFPDMPTFNAQFVNVVDDFRLVPGSMFRGAGTDGKDLGVDFAALDAASGGAATGGASQSAGDGTAPVPPPPAGGGTGVLAPYGGTPVSLPGTIQAENFDEGGPALAYFETTPGNAGGQYRATDVDIESTSDAGGGYDVGWIASHEWLKYTVDVTAAGTYTVDVRVAASGGGGAFHIEANGVDKTGPLTIPNTGGWQAWTTVTTSGVALDAGRQVWTVVFDAAGPNGVVGNVNFIRVSPASAASGAGGSAAFQGSPRALPGTVQAEDFDEGGQGTAYSDKTAGNSGGAYRATDVDIEASGDDGGGYDVGWTSAGEWLAYTVSVAAAGTYDVEMRVASQGGGGVFHVEVDGADKTGPISIPDTGGWQHWTSVVRTGVSLAAGAQVWRLVMDSNGAAGAVGNVNWIRVTASTGSSGSSGSTPFSGTPAPLPGIVQAESFDRGGSGVSYFDLSAGNEGGAFRVTDVDTELTEDADGGYDVGWVGAGEWLQYTVSVQDAGVYDIAVRVASSGPGGTFHIEVNGIDRTGPIAVPDSGGWQSWTTVWKSGVSLGAGTQVWRLVMDSDGESGAVGNFNFFEVRAGG